MALEESQTFSAVCQPSSAGYGQSGLAFKSLFGGISVIQSNNNGLLISVAVRDANHSVDFKLDHLAPNGGQKNGEVVADYVICMMQNYERANLVKFIAVGIPTTLLAMSSELCSQLWQEADIIPIVTPLSYEPSRSSFWDVKTVDEQADSMARKCIVHFGPHYIPRLQVDSQCTVQVDIGSKAHLCTAQDHELTVGENTWKSMIHFAVQLKEKNTRAAFFSSSPQFGSVARMRHALVRFSKLLGVDLAWYAPKPQPWVSKIRKKMRSILEGVANADLQISNEEYNELQGWIIENARRYWLPRNGPLRPVREGGAHVIVIDDFEMSGLVPIIKSLSPDRPVIYRSHTEIRFDLVAQAGSPQAEIWKVLWGDVCQADIFVSHPMRMFAPCDIPQKTLAYMPATTDWLDGLNKPLDSWYKSFYIHQYNLQCETREMNGLDYPKRKYILQISPFSPSEGIDTVLRSYSEFHKLLDLAQLPDKPQLVIAEHPSLDGPFGDLNYGQMLEQIQMRFPHLADDISVMQLDGSDQLLNTLISSAHVVLQLSTSGGFETKVLESLHAGRPVITIPSGEIPFHLRDKENGFLVEPGNYCAVAQHLLTLFTKPQAWAKMSHAARTGVTDETSTPGNALSWYYLFTKLTGTGGLGSLQDAFKGHQKWVNDMAREEAEYPYREGENRLPRSYK